MSEYISTRGAYHDNPRTYSDVVLEGQASDGGLYVPAAYPRVLQPELESMKDMNYKELFLNIRSKFVGTSMTIDEQAEMADNAYTSEKFPTVVDDNYVPVRQIGHNLFIQNLSLGPTAAFKDMAMQALAQDMKRELSLRGQHLTILGATSGDTGSAAEAALKDLDMVDIFMLSPLHGKMSDFQRAQMAELSSQRIHNISMDAMFSPLQDFVKDIKKDPEFADIGAVNSINWARVASQVPYYFSGYLQAIEQSGSSAKIGDEVDFVVPSGNMGNALAAFIAKEMGLPIRKIVVATNENGYLHHLIQDGIAVSKGSVETSSPSMDIDTASNDERLLFEAFGKDADATRRFREQLRARGIVSFADVGLGNVFLRELGLDSGTSSHQKRMSTMKKVLREGNGFIDPHTADAVGVAYDRGMPEIPTICMETALPVKFEDTVFEATGRIPERPQRFERIEESLNRQFGFVALKYDIDTLKQFIRERR